MIWGIYVIIPTEICMVALLYRTIIPIHSEKIIDKLENFGLYLRSFKDDNYKILDWYSSNRKDFTERNILRIFKRILPVYTIGAPLELFPPVGSKRIYVDDKNWKNQVEKLVYKAKFIILKIGDTENFLWETKHCIKNTGTDKLIFIYDKDSNDVYNSFKSFLKDSFSIDIPDYELSNSKNFFIYFENNVAILKEYYIESSFLKNSFKNIAIQFLNDHSELNEENEIFLLKKKNFFNFFFSFKKDLSLDKNLRKWNCGAFIFGWTYGVFNNFSSKCWCYPIIISFILLCPFYYKSFILFIFSFIVRLFYGYNGNKIAWLSKRWESEAYFKMIQKRWNIAGIIFLFLLILLIIINIIK
jgi:hypothetical protein